MFLAHKGLELVLRPLGKLETYRNKPNKKI